MKGRLGIEASIVRLPSTSPAAELPLPSAKNSIVRACPSYLLAACARSLTSKRARPSFALAPILLGLAGSYTVNATRRLTLSTLFLWADPKTRLRFGEFPALSCISSSDADCLCFSLIPTCSLPLWKFAMEALEAQLTSF